MPGQVLPASSSGCVEVSRHRHAGLWDGVMQPQVRAHTIWGKIENSSDSHGSQSSSQEKAAQADILAKIHFNDLSDSSNCYSPTTDRSKEMSKEQSFDRSVELGKEEERSHSGHASGSAHNLISDERRAESALHDIQEVGQEDEQLGDSSSGNEQATGSKAEWSLGSVEHGTGKCRPCRFANSPAGCAKGKDCTFCHMDHSKTAYARPCKSKRIKCKKFVKTLVHLSKTDPERLAETVSTVTTTSPYLQSMLRKRLPAVEQQLSAEDASERKQKHIVSL